MNDWSWKPDKQTKESFVKSKEIKKKKKRKRRGKNNRSKKVKNDFYQTWEWKKLRYAVLKKYGSTCMCCGASNKDKRLIVVDHIKPIRKRPDLALVFDNLQVLCNCCNMGKSYDDETDFREPLPDGAYEHMDEIRH